MYSFAVNLWRLLLIVVKRYCTFSKVIRQLTSKYNNTKLQARTLATTARTRTSTLPSFFFPNSVYFFIDDKPLNWLIVSSLPIHHIPLSSSAFVLTWLSSTYISFEWKVVHKKLNYIVIVLAYMKTLMLRSIHPNILNCSNVSLQAFWELH